MLAIAPATWQVPTLRHSVATRVKIRTLFTGGGRMLHGRDVVTF